MGLLQRKYTDPCCRYNKKQISQLRNILPTGNNVQEDAGQDPKDIT